MLKHRNVNNTFYENSLNDGVALSNIQLELLDGDFVTVIGSNGAGKSTVVNTIAGKISPDTGTAETAGQNVTRMKDARRAENERRRCQEPMAATAPALPLAPMLTFAPC